MLHPGNPRPGRYAEYLNTVAGSRALWTERRCVVDNRAYLFDAGGHHTSRRRSDKVRASLVWNRGPLRGAFLTISIPNPPSVCLISFSQPWGIGRTEPFELWCSKGTRAIVEHILAAEKRPI